MATLCRAYGTEDEARAAVGRLLATGPADAEIRVVAGTPSHDRRAEPAGTFAGEAAGGVGTFSGEVASGASRGRFTEGVDPRRGSFGDLDRETVTTYEDGVRRVHVASHHRLQRLLVDAGLDEDVAAADVAALHEGRVLVLVRADEADPVAQTLDAG